MARQMKLPQEMREAIRPTKSDVEKAKARDSTTPMITDKNGNQRRHKISQVQLALRVQQTLSWLLDGHTSTEVVTRAMERWKISARQAWRYLGEAKAQFEAATAGEAKSAVTVTLYRLTELYMTAMKEKDLKTALDVLKVQNRMLGLNAPEKIESREVADWNTMDISEQLEAVSKMIEKAEKRVTN